MSWARTSSQTGDTGGEMLSSFNECGGDRRCRPHDFPDWDIAVNDVRLKRPIANGADNEKLRGPTPPNSPNKTKAYV